MAGNLKKHYILFPFAIIYWIITYIRNRLFDWNLLQSKEFEVPVICVGNITVGGTGKTPHIEYLIRFLKKEFIVGVLSRGYKRKTKGFIFATEESNADQIGDEPCQIKKKFPEIHLAVNVNRVKGIEKLLQQVELDIILLDDAYQHRFVKPGISILLIDSQRLISDDCILPVGRLREQVTEMHRANIIIVTKCPLNIKPIEKRILIKEIDPKPYQKLYFTAYTYGELEPVFSSTYEIFDFEKTTHNNPSILLVTGIANPLPIKEELIKSSKNIYELRYPDHHNYSTKDIEQIVHVFNSIADSEKIIVTTEKDSVRFQKSLFPEEISKQFFYIPVKVDFLFNEQDEFISYIMNYVRKNKKYRDISSKEMLFKT